MHFTFGWSKKQAHSIVYYMLIREIEEFQRQLKLGFEIVTGTQIVTS
jgi:hypothetical protein